MTPSPKTIHERFEEIANRFPASIAVIGDGRALTYAALNECANRLSRRLIRLGVGPGVPVAINLHRSLEAVIAMLAVLKAGGAYAPIDPSYPDAVRQSYIRELDARCVITLNADGNDDFENGAFEIDCLAGSRCVGAAANAVGAGAHPAGTAGEDLPAYIMFTSGSTGSPKGVVVPHRGVLRLVIDTNYIQLGPDDVLLQFAPITFDASTFEIWGALLNGGRLVVYEDTSFDLNLLNALVRKTGVTVMWLTAALFHLVARRAIHMFEGLHVLLAGGDVLNPDAVKLVLRTYPHLILINGYGPTENTTFTCCHVMTADSPIGETVPIGLPVTGTTVQVLDDDMLPVKTGDIGELYAGGLGVALGYLNAPERSAASFIPDPADPTRLLYKTGDLVRQTPEGAYEFIGRVDNEVKIRGHRVSIEEVRRRINDIQGVEDSVICVQTDPAGERRLAGFVQSKEDPAHFRIFLRNELAARLPHFMVPDMIVVQKQLPINGNGKLDRAKLVAMPSFTEE